MTARASALRVPAGPQEAGRLRRPGPEGPTARVLALQRTAGNRAVRRLLRQVKTAPDVDLSHIKLPTCADRGDVSIKDAEQVKGDKDKLKVTLSDGSVYLVTRKRRLIVSEDKEFLPPKFSTGSDADRVWVQLQWCRGARGEIRLGANPQGALKDVAKTISDTISNFGTPKEVVDAVKDADVTPFLSVDLAESGEWHVSGEIDVRVNRTGLRGATVSLEAQKGRFGAKGDLIVDEQGHVTGATGSLVIHEAPPEKFKCPTREKVYLGQRTEYEWTPWIPDRQETGTRPVTKEVPANFYVYFEYASKQIVKKRSAPERKRLEAELAQGARVVKVIGFTSPEGQHDPVPGFKGNVELGKARGKAALDWARDAVKEAKAGSVDVAEADVADESELHTVVKEQNGRKVDVEGKPLEETAVEGFETAPEEERHRTPELEQEIAKAKTTHQKAELVYPWLRRAVICTTRTVQDTETYTYTVPGHYADAPTFCPPVSNEEIAKRFPRVIL